MTGRDGWLLLHNLYVVPRWIEQYIRATVEIADVLHSTGALRSRSAEGFTTMSAM